MANDFVIFANGMQIENFTEAQLNRDKGEMTGTLNFKLFCTYMPDAPMMVSALTGAEITAYVGGQLAFVGSIDRRRGTGARGGTPGTNGEPASGSGSSDASGGGSVNVGPNEYTLSITARGKTKQLIDSSHKHPTGTMLRPSTREVIDTLLEGLDIGVEWLATTLKLDKVRFRDGAKIVDELQRVGNENAYFIYETRDGNLRVTDDTARTIGDSLVLGQNILTFSAEQGEDLDRAEIRVKGQRTPNEVWGEAALVDTQKTVQNANSTNKAVVTLQHYGDGTPEALERRANFEANKRNAASKTVTVEVFHVQANGNPWDIGNIHYVEIPPEGLFAPMECTGLSFVVDAQQTLKTVLKLSPLPAGGISGGSMTGFEMPGLDDLVTFGAGRKGLSKAASFGVSWGGPQLAISNPLTSLFTLANQVDKLAGLAKDNGKDKPPKTLPPTFGNPRR
jgi:prophage tail gpP-like protein